MLQDMAVGLGSKDQGAGGAFTKMCFAVCLGVALGFDIEMNASPTTSDILSFLVQGGK